MNRFTDEHSEVDTAISKPVTERSRITGVETTRRTGGVLLPAQDTRTVDWGAVVASVVAGLAFTSMLVILGMSTGLIAGSEDTGADDAAGILGAIGAWTVVAAVIGAFVGSLLGGRLARWLDRGTLAYHAFTSWGLATLLSILLATMVAIGFSSTATSAATSATAADQATATPAEAGGAEGAATDGAAGGTDGQTGEGDGAATTGKEKAENTADALGGAGVALTLGMLLTLAASFAGWWVGSRKRLTDFEREDGEDVVVA